MFYVQTAYYKSPIGILKLNCDGDLLTGLYFCKEGGIVPSTFFEGVLLTAKNQLEQYFNGERKSFDIPIKIQMSEFRNMVYSELLKIPYGETRSYSDIAKAVGKPNAVRAVGGANHVNPISIIVPCHRVIGKHGSLTGYGGGLENKKILLELESKFK